jgi:proteasome assembly chaperone (PAC2) family protein
MPGIGNVGKIVMDVLIEETKAVLMTTFYSKNLPNSVFVNEDNLIDLPKIAMYYKKIDGQDFLFLTGDAQPVTEHASYTFSEIIINICKELDCKYIITLGGIGLKNIPETPKVYITGNDKKFVEDISNLFKKKKLTFETKIYGMVGPIIGISGLLLGIAKKHNIKAYCLLSETLGHPVYVGLKGSKSILNILISQYGFKIKLDKLDKEIKQMDAQLGILSADGNDDSVKIGRHPDVNYIG